jgi:hypothetical protein
MIMKDVLCFNVHAVQGKMCLFGVFKTINLHWLSNYIIIHFESLLTSVSNCTSIFVVNFLMTVIHICLHPDTCYISFLFGTEMPCEEQALMDG